MSKSLFKLFAPYEGDILVPIEVDTYFDKYGRAASAALSYDIEFETVKNVAVRSVKAVALKSVFTSCIALLDAARFNPATEMAEIVSKVKAQLSREDNPKNVVKKEAIQGAIENLEDPMMPDAEYRMAMESYRPGFSNAIQVHSTKMASIDADMRTYMVYNRPATILVDPKVSFMGLADVDLNQVVELLKELSVNISIKNFGTDGKLILKWGLQCIIVRPIGVGQVDVLGKYFNNSEWLTWCSSVLDELKKLAPAELEALQSKSNNFAKHKKFWPDCDKEIAEAQVKIMEAKPKQDQMAAAVKSGNAKNKKLLI